MFVYWSESSRKNYGILQVNIPTFGSRLLDGVNDDNVGMAAGSDEEHRDQYRKILSSVFKDISLIGWLLVTKWAGCFLFEILITAMAMLELQTTKFVIDEQGIYFDMSQSICKYRSA